MSDLAQSEKERGIYVSSFQNYFKVSSADGLILFFQLNQFLFCTSIGRKCNFSSVLLFDLDILLAYP